MLQYSFTPQMSPIYWLILLMYFIFMLVMLIMFIFFPITFNKITNFIKDNSMIWTW